MEFLLSSILPFVCVIAVCGLLPYGFWRYFKGENPPVPQGSAMSAGRLLLLTLAWALLTRAALFLFVAAFSGRAIGPIAHSGPSPWVRWDANNYLGLARDGYVNHGEDRLRIVFFPLYPLIVRALSALVGDVQASAFAVSILCLTGSGYALYRMMEDGYGSESAGRALRYLMLCPVSLFFSVPYGESLFLMLTLLCALNARRGKIYRAVFFGALASATRMLGLVCAVPVFYECLRLARKRARGDAHTFWIGALKGFFVSCLVALGFAAYLYLNFSVTGDPLTFLTYQKEHWHQSFGNLYNTIRYTAQNLLGPGDIGTKMGVWGPQMLAIVLVLALLVCAFKKTLPGDAAFALVYFYIALSPTWLLSGARYLGAMYALYPMLALVTRRPWQNAILTAFFSVGSAYCAYVYAVSGYLF